MAYPGHRRRPSDNSPTSFNRPSVTTQRYHPSLGASFNEFEQQHPLRINNRSRHRLSPSAGCNGGLHTRTVYGPPIIDYTRPADFGLSNTSLGFQPNTPNLRNQQSVVQPPIDFPNHGQAAVFADQIQEGPRNQVGDIAQRFRGAQGQDISSNSLTTFPSGYEQQFQLGIHQAIEPSSRPQTLGFLREDPSDPQNATNLRARERNLHSQRGREDPQGRENGKYEKRGQRKKMDAIGGACFFCRWSKKDCDLTLNCRLCQKNGLVCFRGFETLSLHGINFKSPNGMGLIAEAREAIIHDVKRTFSVNIDRLIRELNSEIIPESWQSEAVLEFRVTQPDSYSIIALDTTLVTNFPGFATLPVSWEEPLLKMMPTPQFPHFPDLKSSPILQTAASMLQLFTLIVSITHAKFYSISGHLLCGRATLVFILAYLRDALAKKSERLMSGLKQLQDRKRPETPYDVWLAIGVYSNIVDGLFSFNPPSMVTDIFSNMKSCLVKVSRAIKCILEKTYKKLDPPPDGGVAGRLGLWTAFSQQVPLPLIPQSLDVAFYFRSQAPTALARQFSLFDLSPTAVSELLSTDFDRKLSTSIDPSLLLDIEGEHERMPYGNFTSSTLPWTPSRRREQSSGSRSDLRRTIERTSLRISNQGTEVSDGEDSTLAAQSAVDAEDDRTVHSPMSPNFDYTSLGPNFDNLYYDIKNYAENREPFHDRRKHNRSRGSASSSQSRPSRNKQLRFHEDYETNYCLDDFHLPDSSYLSV